MKWIELAVTVERVVIDEVTTLFDTFTENGIIEEEVVDHPEWVQLTVYGDSNDTEESLEAKIRHILADNHIDIKELTVKTVTDEDWLNSWQQYIEPTEILPNIIIKPAWKDYKPRPDDKVLEIDSELSFGTGAHETTRSCAQLMAKYGQGKKVCLDIGTGTAILLLVASALGIKRLVGIDIDPAAVEQAKANCHTNQVAAELIVGDLDHAFTGTADLILANLTVDPLKILLPQIGPKLDKHGILIISGIIDERYEEIMPTIKRHWNIVEEVVTGPWHTLALSH